MQWFSQNICIHFYSHLIWVFFLNLITKFIRLSTLFFDLNHILYISFFANCFLIQDFSCVCHVWWHVVPCSLKFQFHYTNNLIGYALTFGDLISLLVIRFSCRSCTFSFSFTLLYFTIFFFLLVNFLQQTLVNFRLISVFTLFFQSLNQQNKTINTNNERKNQKRYCIDSLRACYLFFISAVFVVWFYVNPFRSRLRLEYDISLISQKTTLNSVARSTHNVLCYCYLYWMCWCASVLFN